MKIRFKIGPRELMALEKNRIAAFKANGQEFELFLDPSVEILLVKAGPDIQLPLRKEDIN